jgi:hypothetical protein
MKGRDHGMRLSGPDVEPRLEQIRVALKLDAAAIERWRAASRRTPSCVARRARSAPLESRRSTQPGNL